MIKIKFLEQMQVSTEDSSYPPQGSSHRHKHQPWVRSSTMLWIGNRYLTNITVSIRTSWRPKGRLEYTITVRWWVLRFTASLSRQEKKLSPGMMMSCTSSRTWEKGKSMNSMVKLIGKTSTITFLKTLDNVIYFQIKISSVVRWSRTSKSYM